MDPIRFGGDIRLLRHHRGWTQARLARAVTLLADRMVARLQADGWEVATEI